MDANQRSSESATREAPDQVTARLKYAGQDVAERARETQWRASMAHVAALQQRIAAQITTLASEVRQEHGIAPPQAQQGQDYGHSR